MRGEDFECGPILFEAAGGLRIFPDAQRGTRNRLARCRQCQPADSPYHGSSFPLMKRISFNPEINLGHVMTTAGFIGSLTVFVLTFAGDFKLIKADVQRHEATINRLTETESILA